jgi:hypothetical protein
VTDVFTHADRSLLQQLDLARRQQTVTLDDLTDDLDALDAALAEIIAGDLADTTLVVDRLGINGTPTSRLHVFADTAGEELATFRDDDNGAALTFSSPSASRMSVRAEGGDILLLSANDDTDGHIRIATNGHVGIGTDPSYPVHVLTGDEEGFVQDNGTVRVATYVDTQGYIGTLTNHAFGLYVNNGAPSLRVDTTGRVGIGANITANYRLDVVEDRVSSFAARFFNDGNATTRWGIAVQCGEDAPAGTNIFFEAQEGDGTATGRLQTTGAGTFALADVSDERLKVDVRDSEVDARNIVRRIGLISYRRAKGEHRYAEVPVGFSAQRCREVLPDMVSEDEDGQLWVMPAVAIPYLVKAFQELDAEVAALRGTHEADA